MINRLTPTQSLGEGLSPNDCLPFVGKPPAVALRFTAGYAHHTPCGVKIPIAV
ncbi:MAG: hypothetical protein LBU34_05055 [Planctomycetaceae bacterium]|nr:hypothetical protein [Planctomycetaceae bacterium]